MGVDFAGVKGELTEEGLFLSSIVSVSMIDKIIKLYDGKISFINLPSKKAIKLECGNNNDMATTLALDLQEYGADIKIKKQLKNFLQPPPFVRRGFPENWEFGF